MWHYWLQIDLIVCPYTRDISHVSNTISPAQSLRLAYYIWC